MKEVVFDTQGGFRADVKNSKSAPLGGGAKVPHAYGAMTRVFAGYAFGRIQLRATECLRSSLSSQGMGHFPDAVRPRFS